MHEEFVQSRSTSAASCHTCCPNDAKHTFRQVNKHEPSEQLSRYTNGEVRSAARTSSMYSYQASSQCGDSGCSAGAIKMDARTGNSQNIEDEHVDRPNKKVWRPNVSPCCRCGWRELPVINVRICKELCLTAHCVIKVLTLWSSQTRFLHLCINYIHTKCIKMRNPVMYAYIYIHIYIYTCI
jgi:hypothetical protein